LASYQYHDWKLEGKKRQLKEDEQESVSSTLACQPGRAPAACEFNRLDFPTLPATPVPARGLALETGTEARVRVGL